MKATHDHLTGIWNRGALIEILEKTLHLANREKKTMAVMQIDLDHFKLVNDTYGHDVGDQVLQEVGKRFGKCCRESDTVGRMGGEEFLAILYPCREKRILPTGNRFRRAICDYPIKIIHDTTNELRVTTSIGACLVNKQSIAIGATAILKKADECLYIAKNSGRNRIVAGSL